MAKGIDPQTGEAYPIDSPYQSLQTIQALNTAIQSLERAKKTEERRRQLPGSAGKPWEDNEDQRLISAFDSGKTAKELAEEHQRTEGSIRTHLHRHGRAI